MQQIVVNNRKSEVFALGRGTRQDCPLLPLLFTPSLELLAAWIRRDPMIRGLRWTEGWEDRISLYNILLYLASPEKLLHIVLHIFTNFG